MLQLYFEKYGTSISTIQKEKIEKILEILSNEMYYPLQFNFPNEIVSFHEVAKALKEKFGK